MAGAHLTGVMVIVRGMVIFNKKSRHPLVRFGCRALTTREVNPGGGSTSGSRRMFSVSLSSIMISPL